MKSQTDLAQGKLKDGKGKGIICKMLGACYHAACNEKKQWEDEKRELFAKIERLQEKVQRQKMQLVMQGLTLQKHRENEKILEDKVVQMVSAKLEKQGGTVDALKVQALIQDPEHWDGDIWNDPNEEEDDWPDDGDTAQGVFPVIKHEISGGAEGRPAWDVVKTTAFTPPPLDLAKLQMEFGKQPDESAIE